MKTKSLFFTIVLMLGLSTGTVSKADIIFDNFTGETSYSSGAYLARYVNEECTIADCFLVMQDIPLVSDYTLSSITFPLAVLTGAPNEVTISLYSGSGGLPSTLIESWMVSGQMAVRDSITVSDPAHFNLVTANSVLEPLLQAGEQYFFGYSVPSVTPYYIYSPASLLTGTHTLVDSFDNGNTWSLRTSGTYAEFMAFRVEGNVAQPVPEPSTLLLLGSGLVGLVGFGRKKFKK